MFGLPKLLISACLLICTTNIFANGVCIVDADRNEYFNLKKSFVDVQVNNQIAIVTSTQVFNNDYGADTPIKYAFPLASDANPILLRYRLNGADWVEASFNADTQDNNIPGSGGSSTGGSGGGGSGAAAGSPLANYLGARPILFSFVNPIPIGAELEIEIQYVQLLPYEFGTVSFHYPNNYTAIQNEKVELLFFNFELESERSIVDLNIDGLNAVENFTANHGSVSFEASNNIATYDYNVSYELASNELGVYDFSTKLPDSLFKCDPHGEGYLTMLIEPESNDGTDVIEKNFTLIIDRSGSMQENQKMQQAREAASFIVRNLNQGDYFNIIDFSGSISKFKPSLISYTETHKNQALAYISNMGASGSTNISGALYEAIDLFQVVDSTKANIIIFFTDGQATSGIRGTQELVEYVDDKVQSTEKDIFLFTFGIGTAPNKELLTLLAAENNGLATFLGDDELEETITKFFLKINNPVLINTSIRFVPDIIYEIFPDPLPNLYKGQQLIISGRYNKAMDVVMQLEGTFYNSQIKYEFPINLSEVYDPNFSILPQIWAKQKIDALTIDYHLTSNSIAANALQEEIDSIGACYNVISVEFNSFEDSSLEIDLAYFDLEVEDKSTVNLTWATTAEINNDYFIIERSADGEEFTEIARIEGAKNSFELLEYLHQDLNPSKGICYYRLVAVDYDGARSYSKVIACNIAEDFDLISYPNPVQGNKRFIIKTATTDQPIELIIYNGHGQMILTDSFINSTEINVEDFPPGIYYAQLNSNRINELIKIVIQ